MTLMNFSHDNYLEILLHLNQQPPENIWPLPLRFIIWELLLFFTDHLKKIVNLKKWMNELTKLRVLIEIFYMRKSVMWLSINKIWIAS